MVFCCCLFLRTENEKWAGTSKLYVSQHPYSIPSGMIAKQRALHAEKLLKYINLRDFFGSLCIFCLLPGALLAMDSALAEITLNPTHCARVQRKACVSAVNATFIVWLKFCSFRWPIDPPPEKRKYSTLIQFHYDGTRNARRYFSPECIHD